MKKGKRWLISVALLATDITISNAESFVYEGITYNTLTDTTAEVTPNNKVGGKLVIPEYVRRGDKQWRVTSLAYYAFYGCSELTSISLPPTIESIGTGAFMYCTALESITLPQNLKTLGGQVFSNCTSLKEVVWNESIESVEDNLFTDCTALETISWPQPLSTIPYCCFSRSGLRRITIPATVTQLGEGAFSNCQRLEEVDLKDAAFNMVPSYAFSRCNSLKAITLPATVTYIANNAFEGTGLETIILGEQLTSIGDCAFAECQQLNDIYLRSKHFEEQFRWGDLFSTPTYYFGTLHVPEGTANFYHHLETWKQFVNIVEENTSGQRYCRLDVIAQPATLLSVNDSTTYELHTELEAGSPLTISLKRYDDPWSWEPNRYIAHVTVNGANCDHLLRGNVLTVESVQEDMDISIESRTYSSGLILTQDERGGLRYLLPTPTQDIKATVMPAKDYQAIASSGWANEEPSPWKEIYTISDQKTFDLNAYFSEDIKIDIKYQKK